MQRFLMTWLIASVCAGCSGEMLSLLNISGLKPIPLNPPEEDWFKLNGKQVKLDADMIWLKGERKLRIQASTWVKDSKLHLQGLQEQMQHSKLRVRITGILHKEPAPAGYRGQQGGMNPVNGYLDWLDAEEFRIIEVIPLKPEPDQDHPPIHVPT